MMLQHWEPLVLQWPLLGAASRQDLVSKLASSELMFFLAVKDTAAYTEVGAERPGSDTGVCRHATHAYTGMLCGGDKNGTSSRIAKRVMAWGHCQPSQRLHAGRP